MCNKLASRHVRVGLATPSDVPRCDICENAPAFFYCETDGISLCLQCDMTVHVGGKRTHGRYLLLRQKNLSFQGINLSLRTQHRNPRIQGRQEEDRIDHKRHQQERTDRIAKFLQF
ncbi:hypothetical protein OIU76_002316 [Salix suchowensis]|nr:hypothetical protein OIU76_002316 [Salix suchowensis]